MRVLLPVVCLTLYIALLLSAAADEPISYSQGNALMVHYKCASCHALDRASAGPSLRAIARKYASDPTAQGELETMVLNGSAGVWGDDSAMPPTQVPEADLHTVVAWILSLKN
jgi:cytochrome c